MASLAAVLAACGGATTRVASTGPGATRPMPADEGERDAALGALGQRAFAALAAGDPLALLAPETLLDVVLSEDAARRMRLLRARPRELPRDRLQAFAEPRYLGVCAQGSEAALRGGALGLRHPTWTLQRLLVVGEREGGRRLAAWVEADFVFAEEGFTMLDLRRVEAPRWEHSDLEIATCDLRVGLEESE